MNDQIKIVFSQIDQILTSNKPDNQMNVLKQLNEEFVNEYSTEYDRVEKEVQQAVTSQQERVLDNIDKRNVSDTFENQARASFNALLAEAGIAKNLDSLVVIKSKASTRADALLTQVDNFIAEKEQKALRKAAQNTNETSSRKNETNEINELAVPVTSQPISAMPDLDIKHISVGSLPVSKNWELTSAEDIDKNLAQLRAALIEQLNQADQVNLDL